MQKLPIYRQGSSIALLIRVKSAGEPVRVEDYDVEGLIYTKLLGEKVRFSSTDAGKLTLHCIDGSRLGVNIPPEATAGIPAGECSVQMTFTHRATGAKYVAVKKILIMEHSVS